jgi:hypothetical protein
MDTIFDFDSDRSAFHIRLLSNRSVIGSEYHSSGKSKPKHYESTHKHSETTDIQTYSRSHEEKTEADVIS